MLSRRSASEPVHRSWALLLAALALAGCAGAPCTVDSDCLSNICLGGFCCGAACTTDGACGATACAQSTGACVYPSIETACRDASCTDAIATAAAACDGSGNCAAGVTTACKPYICDASACKTSCAGDADCVPGAHCEGTSCTLKIAGAPCSADNGCLSGSCLGGICCAAACLTGGPCGAAACASGTGDCAYPSNDTPCRDASCTAGVAVAAAWCTGAGTCPDATTTACSPYACDATACKTSCAGDGDCTPGDPCVAGLCKKLPRPGCDQFPHLVDLEPAAGHCAQNCCGGQDRCYFDNDCLNAGAGSDACKNCDSMVEQCIGICRLGALDCSNMICGCAQSRCYDAACGDGQAGYCAPSCNVASASPCGPQHPGEIMSGGAAQVVNAGYNMNMGFKFTPTAAATATKLGGLYNGTMIVRLYENPTSMFNETVIAQATHTSANAFSYTPIAPVALTAGTLYGVAVDLAGGSAAAYTRLEIPDDNTRYGKTIVNCPAYGLSGGTPYSCSAPYYYGMADVELSY